MSAPLRVERRPSGVAVLTFALPERRNAMTVSVTERQLYLELNGTTLSTEIHAHPVAPAP